MSRREILNAARRMITGELDVITGCGTICRERRDLPAEDRDSELLSPFIAFDSELDAFPLGRAREQWNAVALREKDLQLAAIVDAARSELLGACRELIDNWS